MIDLSQDITLKEIRARYNPSRSESLRLPDAERMWSDVRALLFMIEDLEHELGLAQKHLAVCDRWEAVTDHDRDKAASNQ